MPSILTTNSADVIGRQIVSQAPRQPLGSTQLCLGISRPPRCSGLHPMPHSKLLRQFLISNPFGLIRQFLVSNLSGSFVNSLFEPKLIATDPQWLGLDKRIAVTSVNSSERSFPKNFLPYIRDS